MEREKQRHLKGAPLRAAAAAAACRHRPCSPVSPPCPAPCLVPAGQTISHIKQVPGWSERLASDSEAVVKAEHEVRPAALGGAVRNRQLWWCRCGQQECLQTVAYTHCRRHRFLRDTKQELGV